MDLMGTADHIEIDHERELAPGTTGIEAMHREMHRNRDDWEHTHGRDGEVKWSK